MVIPSRCMSYGSFYSAMEVSHLAVVSWQGSTACPSASSMMTAVCMRGVEGRGVQVWRGGRSVLSVRIRPVRAGLRCRWGWGCVACAGVVLWCGMVWVWFLESCEPRLLRVPRVSIAVVWIRCLQYCSSWFWSVWWGVVRARMMLPGVAAGSGFKRASAIAPSRNNNKKVRPLCARSALAGGNLILRCA